MRKVYIAGAKRTPIGSFLGSLKDVPAPELGAIAIKAALEQANVAGDQVCEVIMGNVLQAGVGQGPARQAAIKAGIPVDVTAHALNMVCGSGLKSVMNGYVNIAAGFEEVVVAGGMENMSRAPYHTGVTARVGNKMGDWKMIDHMVTDALTDAFNHYHMGITAENIAKKYNITREAQDQFALASQQKGVAAVASGAFQDEITPVTLKTRKGETVFDTDEYPRESTIESLAKLKPAFLKENGTVTAGNASGINDAGSAVVLVSDEYAEKHGVKPLVEVIAIGQGGVDPSVMGLGPTPAIQNALKMANLNLTDIDILELNEAFAAQSLGVVHELAEIYGVSEESILNKTNLNGGAISIGHPVGASGNRILVTLIYLMKKQKAKYGLASLCIGGGMGCCVIVKNTEVE